MNLVTSLLEAARTGLLLLLTLTILVAVHELGHYLFAKWCGMHVNAFAIMMGGVRKTELEQFLAKPLARKGYVWLSAFAALALWVAGVLTNQETLVLAGLAALTFVVPAWIGMRLERLYHLPNWEALRKLGMSWLGALALLGVGTRFQNVNPGLILGVLMAGSMVGLLMLYYHPVASKAEDTDMGEGQIELPEKDPDTGQNQQLQVRFRPIWAWSNKEGTEFSLLALPLGGFAAIKGMHAKDDGSEVDVPQGFYSKSPVKRFWVLFAGPLFSIVFGILIMTGLFATIGERVADTSPKFGAMGTDSAAYKAGLRPDDVVTAVDGKPVNAFIDIIKATRTNYRTENGVFWPNPMQMDVLREGKTMTFSLVPTMDSEPTPVLGDDLKPTKEMAIQAKMGVIYASTMKRHSLADAFVAAAKYPVDMVNNMAQMLTSWKTAKENLGGPMTMATVASTASGDGWYGPLIFAALLSISLGVMNLLPFPPLDGGQIVVALIEMIRGGRRLSMKVQQSLHTAGFAAVMAMMALAFIVDLGRQTEKPNSSMGEIVTKPDK